MRAEKWPRDYLPIAMEKSLKKEDQEVVKAFFRCLITLNRQYPVSRIMSAYRRSRMTNTQRGKRFLYANI